MDFEIFGISFSAMIFGLILGIAGIPMIITKKWKKKRYICKGLAIIKGFNSRKKSVDDDMVSTEYQYQLQIIDMNGNSLMISSPWISNKLGSVGSSVEIRYNPYNISDILYKRDKISLFGSYCITVIGWLLFIFGLLILVFVR